MPFVSNPEKLYTDKEVADLIWEEMTLCTESIYLDIAAGVKAGKTLSDFEEALGYVVSVFRLTEAAKQLSED